MWIGNSLLFNWLDRSLRPGDTAERGTPALGTIWLLHSGGFYYVEKTLLAGEPRATSAALVQMAGVHDVAHGRGAVARRVLPRRPRDSRRSDRGGTHARRRGGRRRRRDRRRVGALRIDATLRRAASAGDRPGGCGSPASRRSASRSPNYSRGARRSCTSGAMLGTIMAGNVVMTIVPSQRELVASVGGRGADPAISARAKRVSIHNNYFTFPVIALMVSNHFPMLYGQRWSWAIAARDRGGGRARAALLNIRFTFAAWKPALAATIVVSAGALYGLARAAGRRPPLPVPAERVGDGDVRRRTTRDRSPVRGLSFGAAGRFDVRRGAGRGHVRYARPDRRARVADSRARGRHSHDAAGEQDEHQRRGASDPRARGLPRGRSWQFRDRPSVSRPVRDSAVPESSTAAIRRIAEGLINSGTW